MTGRYGTIPELIEAVVVSTGFQPRESGRPLRSGYHFMVLPDGSVFAWPQVRNGFTRRSFHMGQDEKLHACDRFEGTIEPLRVDETWTLLDQ
ncbi:MAG: hypothetical protein ACYTGN_00035 [Planctomycetota bacterium]|jgi:hypothetical protein